MRVPEHYWGSTPLSSIIWNAKIKALSFDFRHSFFLENENSGKQ
jgi:hypothetical protein